MSLNASRLHLQLSRTTCTTLVSQHLRKLYPHISTARQIYNRIRSSHLEKSSPDYREMSKTEMYTFGRPYSPRSRSRSILVILLFILCVPVFLYQLVPAFTRSTDTIIENVVAHFWETPCTSDIGDGQCCALFMKATPCVEECRKRFVDRETFTLTLEYDECADTCLRDWQGCNGVSRDHAT